MKRLASALVLSLIFGVGSTQYYPKTQPAAQVPAEVRIAMRADGIGVRVDQKLNDFVPLDAKFQDEKGKTIELKKYFHEKPVILLPIFYKCRCHSDCPCQR